MVENEGFWSIKEVSEYLNIRQSTLYCWAKTGEIPHYKLGKIIRFKRADIDVWMENHKREGISVDKKVRGILRGMNRPIADINHLVKKTIEQTKGVKYNSPSGNQVESSTRRGGDYGVI
jgi:excisionase family DNA binding protein